MRESKNKKDKVLELKRDNALGLDDEQNEKKNIKRYILFFFIFLVALYFATFGITVSYYKGGSDKDHEIDVDPTPTVSPIPSDNPVPDATDQIIFTYSDVTEGGSGINIKNAIPMSDEKGKLLTGTGNYFDFSVTATSKSANLLYKILIRKDALSTLNNDEVRIYLTATSGAYEKELVLTTFDNLEKTTVNGTEYYVIYQKQLTKGISNYSDFYRLRMWVKEDATDYNDKIFMIKVDVVAEQVGD